MTSWTFRAVDLDGRQTLVRWSCAAVIAMYLGAVALLMAGPDSAIGQRLAAGVGSGAVAVAALIAATIVLRVALGCDGRQRRAWMLFAASLVTWCIGAGSWAASHFSAVDRSVNSPGDLWYVATVALYTLAVLSLPGVQSGRQRLRIVADGLIVGSATAVVIWVVAGRELAQQTDSLLSTASAMAYPLVDIALAVICLSALNVIERRVAAESVMFMVGVAFAVITVGDINGLLVRAHGVGAAVTMSTDAARCVGLICIAGAAGFARPGARPMRLHINRRQVAAWLAMFPTLAAASASLVTAFDGLVNGEISSTALMLLILTACLVLVRQTLTLHDNRALGQSLQGAVDELEHQATHDALTALPNRAGLTEQIEHTIARATHRGTLAALLFVDLDHLKSVNDSLGHAAGDRLIVTMAERLEARVGPTVTRFGGDEFVLVLEDAPSIAALDALAQLIVEDASVPTQIDGHSVNPSVSVGLAVAEVGADAAELLRRADVALYRAKSLGRQRAARYDPGNAADARRQVDLGPELRRALDDDQFEVHYQPVVELATGRIDGVEALLRWRHPREGLLAPDSFLAEVIQAGLLGEIGARTLELACAAHAGTGLHVAVNLSTIELTDPMAVERVHHGIDASGIDPSMVTLEITEDVIVDEGIRQTITTLRDLGVRIAIDDFGTGNSSLRQLGSYPADHLKIDRSFIARLEFDHDAIVLVRSVLRLARGLGLTAIAEGVETDEQAGLLVDLSCTLAQGYLFSPALRIEEFRERFPTGRLVERNYLDVLRRPSSDSSAASASAMMRPSSSATLGRSSIAPTT